MAERITVRCPEGHQVRTRVRSRGTTCPECRRCFYIRPDGSTCHGGAPSDSGRGGGAPAPTSSLALAETSDQESPSIGQVGSGVPADPVPDPAPENPRKRRLVVRSGRLPGRNNPDPLPTTVYAGIPC
jgi:hypothetical protein